MLPAVGPPIAILSPHLDDAVLSCWHLLAGPGEVAVINVFAGIPPTGAPAGWWDRMTGHADAQAVVRARRDEDRAALALAQREAVNLDFLDRQYRPGPDPPAALGSRRGRGRMLRGAFVLQRVGDRSFPGERRAVRRE